MMGSERTPSFRIQKPVLLSPVGKAAKDARKRMNDLRYYSILWPVLCDIEVSVLQMEISQVSGDQSVRGATHYDITMGNDIVRDAHYDIRIANDVTRVFSRDIHCDVTMRKDVAMCTYHGMTMHNDIAMPIYVILLWVVWNKNKNKFMFDQSGLENTFLFIFCVGLFHSPFGLMKYPYTKTTYVFYPD